MRGGIAGMDSSSPSDSTDQTEVHGDSQAGSAVANTAEEKEKEVSAAVRIQRMWHLMKWNPHILDRNFVKPGVFRQRLELEESLSKGVSRLTLFSLIFFMLYTIKLWGGVPAQDKLAVQALLDESLDLETFRQSRTLEELREYLPFVSSSIKGFSAANDKRLPDDEAVEIIGERTVFEVSSPLLSVNPKVSARSFTMSVWIEDLQPNPGGSPRNILRMPLQTNRAANCWAWYYPSQFRYGAGDFHSAGHDSSEWEEIVSASSTVSAGPSHEVIVVSDGVITFYRNAEEIGSMNLPRVITDCLSAGNLELGDSELALSSLRFYPNPISPEQVRDIFEGGSLLSELATGTVLRKAQEDTLQQTSSKLLEDHDRIRDSIDSSLIKNDVGVQLVTSLLQNMEVTYDPNYPRDTAPTATLMGGAPMSLHLTPIELQAWTAGGSPTASPFTLEWQDGGSLGHYWSIFENPMYIDGNPSRSAPESEIPHVPYFNDTADGFTVSYWFRSLDPAELYPGGNWFIEKKDGTGHMQITFDASWARFRGGPSSDEIHCEDFLVSQEEQTTGQMKETFYLTSVGTALAPSIWRHLTYQYDRSTRSPSYYLDGKLVFRCSDGTRSNRSPVSYQAAHTVNDIIGNASVHLFPSYYNAQLIQAKAAQLRIYPRALSPDEILQIHEESKWPDGTPCRMCTHENSDFGYFDSVATDSDGHSCAWYAEIEPQFPQVCQTLAAKRMCPVTCKGKRLCHDGGIHPSGFVPPVEGGRYRIFDRIMHIKPKDPSRPVLCPAKTVERQALLAECERLRALDDTSQFYTTGEGYFNYSFSYEERRWVRGLRPDIRSCAQLAAILDEDQCAWDASWIPSFRQDFAAAKSWSLNFWVRPKESSRGMPGYWYPSIHIYTKLAPATLLNDWQQRNPDIDPWADVSFHTKLTSVHPHDFEDGNIVKLFPMLPPTVNFPQGWTFFYAQMEQLADGTYRACAALNAMPAGCKIMPADHSPLFEDDPASFIEGVEFSDEMLISPIEISNRARTPSRIQSLYFERLPRMRSILGPALSETDRISSYSQQQQKEMQRFDNKIALVSPPIIFTQRTASRNCSSRVTRSFFKAQFDLMLSAHCSNSVECNGAPDSHVVSSCQGDFLTNRYFGLDELGLDGKQGFIDFLYTMSSPIVVRDGEVLETKKFLDPQTTFAEVLAIFHYPELELTSILELTAKMGRSDVKTEVILQHFEHVLDDWYGWLLASYVVLFGALLWDFYAVYLVFRTEHIDAKEHGRKYETKVLMEVAMDVISLMSVVALGGILMSRDLGSEDLAIEIINQTASVPFASRDHTLTHKMTQAAESIERVFESLRERQVLNLIVFLVMLLTSLRLVAFTSVHPRTGVITGTLVQASNELWHFGLVFIVIFVFFSSISNAMFGDAREEFADVPAAMFTQFQILLGRVPADFQLDDRLTIFVTVSMLLQFFLLLHFLMAILIQGFLQVRKDIANNESGSNEFFTDLILTYRANVQGYIEKWPTRKHAIYFLRKTKATAIAKRHFRRQDPEVVGADHAGVDAMFSFYSNMEALRAEPPKFNTRLKSVFEVAQTVWQKHLADMDKSTTDVHSLDAANMSPFAKVTSAFHKMTDPESPTKAGSKEFSGSSRGLPKLSDSWVKSRGPRGNSSPVYGPIAGLEAVPSQDPADIKSSTPPKVSSIPLKPHRSPFGVSLSAELVTLPQGSEESVVVEVPGWSDENSSSKLASATPTENFKELERRLIGDAEPESGKKPQEEEAWHL